MISETHNIDCIKFMLDIEDNFFNLAIIDPPYGIGEDGLNNHTRSNLVKAKKYKPYEGSDKNAPSEIYFKELFRVSKNQIIWGANHFISKIPIDSSCWIVWDKCNGDNDFADCELAYTSFTSAVRMVKFMWHGFMQGGDYKGGMNPHKKKNEIRIHPNQKPIALYKWLLEKYAKPGDKIFDSHMGSQSSRIAAHEMGFYFVGCEIDNYYFIEGNKRFELFKQQQKLF